MLDIFSQRINTNIQQNQLQKKLGGFLQNANKRSSATLQEEKVALLKEEQDNFEDEKDPELKPLSDDPEEIKNAENQINEYQPLKDVPLSRLFPWACFCIKFFKDSKSKKDIAEILEDDAEIDKKLDKYIEQLSDKKLKYEGTDYLKDQERIYQSMQHKDDDPFEDYGFGIIAYFNLLRYLIVIYAVCSGLAGYIMWKYTFGNALEDEKGATFNQFSLGNYGFSKSACEIDFIPLMVEGEGKKLKCSENKYLSEIEYMGVAPFDENADFTYIHESKTFSSA